ncbi:MAG: hypothetical protein HY820_43530 [Acidobacteria bacterium]|nr:hypothetical protein [Acidobacteriota bacterium]
MTRRDLLLTAAAAPVLAQAAPRFVGITTMPEWIQNETIDGVLKNLTGRARVTAVTTSPYVMEPASEKDGSREPPIDAGAGSVRLLDRKLWGKRELFVRTAPSFTPNTKLYQGLRYQPAPATDLTRRQGAMVGDFLKEAKRRGLKTYLQVQAAIPPGYRVQFGGAKEDDMPRLPDGRIPARRVANNASLASPHVIQYHCALLRDLAEAYPEINGFRVDWPEYPPYFLDDVFLDCSTHAAKASERHGINFKRLQADTLRLYRLLHGGLTDAMLRQRGPHALATWMTEFPGFVDLLHLKARMVEELLAAFRQALPKDKELIAHAFPPPLSVLSGMNFARAGKHANGICVKAYTMHWLMMLRFYGDALKAANPRVNENLLTSALEHWLELSGMPGSRRLSDYRYPEPEEAHPVSDSAIAEKMSSAQRLSSVPIYALTHGYGPLADYRRRLKIMYETAGRRVWINRYGYLSDAKLEATGQVCV